MAAPIQAGKTRHQLVAEPLPPGLSRHEFLGFHQKAGDGLAAIDLIAVGGSSLESLQRLPRAGAAVNLGVPGQRLVDEPGFAVAVEKRISHGVDATRGPAGPLEAELE